MKSTAFGPNLHAVWRKAIGEVVHLRCGEGVEGKKKAVALRHRLYQLRRCFIDESHELAAASERVSLTMRKVGSEWVVIAHIADTTFDEIIERSGISTPSAPDFAMPEELAEKEPGK
jgi:hypothetical protein